MILELFNTIFPVVACAGLGYLWARFDQPFDTHIVTRLVGHIGAPCLIFSTMVGIQGMSGQIAEMALSAVAVLLAFAAVAATILYFAKLPMRTYLAPVTFPNAGNIGLPLCLFAFGDEGLALGIGFFAISSSAQLIFGQWLFSGLPTPVPLLKAPIPYAVAIGAIFLATDTQPPEFIYNTTELLGGFAIPLMTFTLGVSLAKLKVVRFSRSLALSLLRLGMGAAGGFGFAELFGFEGMERGVLIIQCSMPVAVFNYLFATYYNRDPEEVASLVVLSSTLAFLLMPLLIYAVL
ncbi:MAG: AEC family transporter [Proteobacteria bacterium]|nr:AEC family transporter [Pseudomonadota bacterium]MDA1356666.1 AEC family transporter [Pseudomonadota bacterium]